MSEPRYPALDVRRYLKHLTGCSAYSKDEQACDCGVLRAEVKLEELATDAERKAQQVNAMQIQLNAANDEIERLREQVKEARIEGREEILKTYDGTIGVPLDSWHAQRALLTRLAMTLRDTQILLGMFIPTNRSAQEGSIADRIEMVLAEARAAGVVTE